MMLFCLSNGVVLFYSKIQTRLCNSYRSRLECGILSSRVGVRIRAMVFNATCNNISVILWRSVLLVEETGVSGENHRPVASH